MARPKIAIVADEPNLGRDAHRWLGQSYSVVPVGRGRYLAADLAAAQADLILLEAVHPSEAGWLIAWLGAQPRLAHTPVLIVVPAPAPKSSRRGVAFAKMPLQRPTLLSKVDALLRKAPTRGRDRPS